MGAEKRECYQETETPAKWNELHFQGEALLMSRLSDTRQEKRNKERVPSSSSKSPASHTHTLQADASKEGGLQGLPSPGGKIWHGWFEADSSLITVTLYLFFALFMQCQGSNSGPHIC